MGSLGVTLLVALVAIAPGCARRQPQTEAGNAAVVAALAPTEPPIPGPTYRIGVGDELHIRFLYQPDMSEELPVRPDGRISLGATGEITAMGLTPVSSKVIIERRRHASRCG
jgi:polysaccharide export outer membrane protein